MSKHLLSFLVVVFATGLLIANSSGAEAMAKPSVPEFSLKVTQNTVDYPGVYEINPYTGENVTVTPPYQYTFKYVKLTIKNQPFTAYQDSEGNLVDLYYYIQSKGHFAKYFNSNGEFDHRDKQSSSEYTTISYEVSNMSPNGQIDYRVAAEAGYMYEIDQQTNLNRYVNVFATVDSSDWSNVQTANLADGVVSTSPYPSPTVPEFSLVGSLFAVLAIASLILIVGKKKTAP